MTSSSDSEDSPPGLFSTRLSAAPDQQGFNAYERESFVTANDYDAVINEESNQDSSTPLTLTTILLDRSLLHGTNDDEDTAIARTLEAKFKQIMEAQEAHTRKRIDQIKKRNL